MHGRPSREVFLGSSFQLELSPPTVRGLAASDRMSPYVYVFPPRQRTKRGLALFAGFLWTEPTRWARHIRTTFMVSPSQSLDWILHEVPETHRMRTEYCLVDSYAPLPLEGKRLKQKKHHRCDQPFFTTSQPR